MRIWIAAVVLIVGLASCKTNPVDVQTFKVLEKDWGDIGPRYTSYLEKDPALSDALRTEYLNSARTFGMLISEGAKTK